MHKSTRRVHKGVNRYQYSCATSYLAVVMLYIPPQVLAPTIHQPGCQQQLSESAHEVTLAVDGVAKAARGAGQSMYDAPEPVSDAEIMEVNATVSEVEDAATDVRNTLDRLNDHILKGSARVC